MNSPVKIWRNQKQIAKLIGKTGSLVVWTMVRVPPGDFADQAPYPVVIVNLDQGHNITGQLVDWEPKHLAKGQKVVTVLRRETRTGADSVIPYGIKVKPID